MRSVSLVALIAALLTSGCITPEGIVLSSTRPSEANVDDFSKRNVPKAQEASISSGTLPGIIIIGNVMSFQPPDEKVLNKQYDDIEKAVAAKGLKAPATREQYVQSAAGSVSMKTWGIPGVFSHVFAAMVPKELAGAINFSSVFGTSMLATSADLVSAQVWPIIGPWIDRILCSEKQSDFAECESRYVRGLFQTSDGREIESDTLKPKDSGATIDTTTYFKKR